MSGDPATVRRALRHHDPRRHADRLGDDNSGSPRDARRESTLSVHGPKKLIEIGDVRLELDDKQHSPGRMEPEDVDHAALAADRERHLRPDHPAIESFKPTRDELVQLGVAAVEQTVEVTGTPSRGEVDPHIDSRRDRPDRVDLDGADVTALQSGDRRLGHAGESRQIGLPQASTDPDLA
jgi:hypothetical protein